jgi:hypothetical protein
MIRNPSIFRRRGDGGEPPRAAFGPLVLPPAAAVVAASAVILFTVGQWTGDARPLRGEVRPQFLPFPYYDQSLQPARPIVQFQVARFEPAKGPVVQPFVGPVIPSSGVVAAANPVPAFLVGQIQGDTRSARQVSAAFMPMVPYVVPPPPIPFMVAGLRGPQIGLPSPRPQILQFPFQTQPAGAASPVPAYTLLRFPELRPTLLPRPQFFALPSRVYVPVQQDLSGLLSLTIDVVAIIREQLDIVFVPFGSMR